jgi:hypothetical protein
MLTKKYFELFAESIARIKNPKHRASAALAIAYVCERDNPNFRRVTFFEACNVKLKPEQI